MDGWTDRSIDPQGRPACRCSAGSRGPAANRRFTWRNSRGMGRTAERDAGATTGRRLCGGRLSCNFCIYCVSLSFLTYVCRSLSLSTYLSTYLSICLAGCRRWCCTHVLGIVVKARMSIRGICPRPCAAEDKPSRLPFHHISLKLLASQHTAVSVCFVVVVVVADCGNLTVYLVFPSFSRLVFPADAAYLLPVLYVFRAIVVVIVDCGGFFSMLMIPR